MKQKCMVATLALALAASPALAADWRMLGESKESGITAYIDRDSVRLENGYVHYQDRYVFATPQTVEGTRFSELRSSNIGSCSGRTAAMYTVQVFGADATLLGSESTPVAEARATMKPVTAESADDVMLSAACQVVGQR